MTQLSVAVPAARSGLDDKLKLALLVLLGVFLFSLPLAEAPKNLALGAYLLVWLLRAVRTRDFGGAWDRFDTVFALVLVSALWSGYSGYSGDLGGVGRVIGMAWLVKRSPAPGRFDKHLVIAACAGLLLAIPRGLVPYVLGQRDFFELPSVGHANQSALYIAVLAACAFGWWLSRARSNAEGWGRAALAAVALAFWGALLIGASRAAVLAALAATGVVTVALLRRPGPAADWRPLKRSAVALSILALGVWGFGQWQPELASGKLTPAKLILTHNLEHRVQHWRIAFEAWHQRPWLGFGPEAFQQISVPDVCAWRAQRGLDCDPDRYATASHAHSLYVSTLVERGLLGVLALAVLLAGWAAAMFASRDAAARSPWWIASTASLMVVAVGGLLNTTLRVEHGSLALLAFGLWLAQRPRTSPSQSGEPDSDATIPGQHGRGKGLPAGGRD